MRRLLDMTGAAGTQLDLRICRSFAIMSPTGGCGTHHQRLLAALLDPTAAAERDAVELCQRDDGVPRIDAWWEL
jgi:hypothetical protein